MDTTQKQSSSYSYLDTVMLYRFIYKKAQLSMGILGKLEEKQYNEKISEIISGQRRGYTAILRNAANALAECGARIGGMKSTEKLQTCLEIHLKLGNTKDSEKAIEYLINTTTQLAIEGAKKKTLYRNANKDSKDLMERLLSFEDANCRKLREYL